MGLTNGQSFGRVNHANHVSDDRKCVRRTTIRQCSTCTAAVLCMRMWRISLLWYFDSVGMYEYIPVVSEQHEWLHACQHTMRSRSTLRPNSLNSIASCCFILNRAIHMHTHYTCCRYRIASFVVDRRQRDACSIVGCSASIRFFSFNFGGDAAFITRIRRALFAWPTNGVCTPHKYNANNKIN